MGRGYPIDERVHKNIVEHFKTNVPQCQTANDFQLSSTVRNIVKRFRETTDVCVCKGQRQRLLLDASGLQTTLHHSGWFLSLTLLDGPRNTSWNHCWLTQSTVPLKMPNKALSFKKEALFKHGRKAPLFLWVKTDLKWTVSKWESSTSFRQVQIWYLCW